MGIPTTRRTRGGAVIGMEGPSRPRERRNRVILSHCQLRSGFSAGRCKGGGSSRASHNRIVIHSEAAADFDLWFTWQLKSARACRRRSTICSLAAGVVAVRRSSSTLVNSTRRRSRGGSFSRVLDNVGLHYDSLRSLTLARSLSSSTARLATLCDPGCGCHRDAAILAARLIFPSS